MIHSTLEILTPAASLGFLTEEERRAAAGVDDNSRDAELEALDVRIASIIAAECKVAREDVGDHPPTLLREKVRQTVYADEPVRSIILSRRHSIQILSINGAPVPASIMLKSGMLVQKGGATFHGEYVIEYWAGFATVPDDLKQAASAALRSFWVDDQRDPTVKSQSVEVEGVETIRTDYWVGSLPGQNETTGLPATVLGLLAPYRNYVVA